MKRVQSLDILRGATVALMILVNNPGSWGVIWPPLRHASWNGLTFADLVFPTFLFIMGVSMYFSLHKSGFRLSWKVLKRTLLLILIGLLLNLVGGLVWGGEDVLANLRFTGVLQRFGLCFGICAVLACTVNHKALPWVAGVLLFIYILILQIGNGYSYSPDNIVARVDRWLIPEAHLYLDNGIDPEGILSTIPSVAHTLIGFMIGKLVFEKKEQEVLIRGAILLVSGLLLAIWFPINKKIWSPSFALALCGIGTLLLCGIYYLVDEKRIWKSSGFFKAFGTNAIYCYVLGDCLAWLLGGTGVTGWYAANCVGESALMSFLYAAACVLIVWLAVLPLYKHKIYIKL